MLLVSFLTATGFLTAILLVWGQLWLNSYPAEERPTTVHSGLLWTYLSVLVALIAFCWAGYLGFLQGDEELEIRGVPIALFVTALFMTFLNVGQSIMSVIVKIMKGIPPDKPLLKAQGDVQNHPVMVILGIIIFFVVFLVLSLVGTSHTLAWLLEGVIVIIVLLGLLIREFSS